MNTATVIFTFATAIHLMIRRAAYQKIIIALGWAIARFDLEN
ncbi:hypothetical protein [Ruegeria sp. AU67]|nr:hypothetical protein [Ruegeria sp. AU67]